MKGHSVKAIVSGPNGNLGKHVIQNADFEVSTIGRDDWDKSFANHDVFVHCAYDLKKKVTDKPEEVFDSNILSVMRALELCNKNKVPKFIFISSCSIYGHSSRCHEEMEVVPASINGYTKLLCEKVILEYCEKNNIECLILRVFNSFGGDDQFSVISKMIKAANGEQFFLCNEGKAERDYIYINDVAKVVCHYVKNSSNHKIVNVGTGKTTRIIDILKATQAVLGEFEVQKINNKNEVEYSRADNSLLLSEFATEFVDVLDYIQTLKEK